MNRVSVIMPVYNGETTLEEALKSLLGQADFFEELIVIDDASLDNSVKIVKGLIGENENYKLIENERNLGLANSYNRGIKVARGHLIVTMHQDIILEKDSLSQLIAPFSDQDVVAAGHSDIHPQELWDKYNFWQKCFFSRFQKMNISGINGQFDAFRKSALLEAGLFDEKHFRTAGEDADMVYKLKKIGRVAASRAKTIHLQKIDPCFNWRDIIHKQKQYSEAQGALLALGRADDFLKTAKAFFREILVLMLFIPLISIISVIIIIAYSFTYTGKVFFEEYKNPRIVLLPFFNIFLLFSGAFYSLKGFILKKQTI
jgi:GT2 family glycosyltransferase